MWLLPKDLRNNLTLSWDIMIWKKKNNSITMWYEKFSKLDRLNTLLEST